MADCCGTRPQLGSESVSVCPVSRTKGAPVELQTVKGLLTEAASKRIGSSSHRFCADPSCEVVYFDVDGECDRRSDLRVSVWQKEPFGGGCGLGDLAAAVTRVEIALPSEFVAVAES